MKYIPIACCAFCGDDAPYKASNGTPVCENCIEMYKPKRKGSSVMEPIEAKDEQVCKNCGNTKYFHYDGFQCCTSPGTYSAKKMFAPSDPKTVASDTSETARIATESAAKWVSVKQELPPPDKNHCWLAWITSQNKNGGYIDLVSYGTYVCQNEDIRPGDEGYIEDNDDGNFKQSGWYREEETHGGEYDYIFVNLNGKVTHWQPLPEEPHE